MARRSPQPDDQDDDRERRSGRRRRCPSNASAGSGSGTRSRSRRRGTTATRPTTSGADLDRRALAADGLEHLVRGGRGRDRAWPSGTQNRAASSRRRPANRPAEIEIPDRLMPGIRASACAAPIPNAVTGGRSRASFEREPARSARTGSRRRRRASPRRGRSARGAGPRESCRRNPTISGRDGRDREQHGQPPVRVARQRPVAERREERRHDPEPVGREVEEQRHQRARCGA